MRQPAVESIGGGGAVTQTSPADKPSKIMGQVKMSPSLKVRVSAADASIPFDSSGSSGMTRGAPPINLPPNDFTSGSSGAE